MGTDHCFFCDCVENVAVVRNGNTSTLASAVQAKARTISEMIINRNARLSRIANLNRNVAMDSPVDRLLGCSKPDINMSSSNSFPSSAIQHCTASVAWHKHTRIKRNISRGCDCSGSRFCSTGSNAIARITWILTGTLEGVVIACDEHVDGVAFLASTVARDRAWTQTECIRQVWWVIPNI